MRRSGGLNKPFAAHEIFEQHHASAAFEYYLEVAT